MVEKKNWTMLDILTFQRQSVRVWSWWLCAAAECRTEQLLMG